MKYINYNCIFPLLIIIATGFLPKQGLSQSAQELYQQKCGRCHAAYAPSDYKASEWPGFLRTMRQQAALTTQEYDKIAAYLVGESNRKADSSGGFGPILGGYLYTEFFRSPEKTKNFDIHYLAVSLSGWVNDNIYYFSEFELEHGGTGGNNTFVEQAYIDYWLYPAFAVKIGAIITPFNRFDEFHDPLSNSIISRPQVSREIGVSAWKEVGANLHGYLNLAEKSSLCWDLYAVNGLGGGANLRESRQYTDNNQKLSFGGRLNFLHGDYVELGGSVYRGPWDNGGNYNLTLVGSHLLIRTSIVDVYGEYTRGVSQNPSPTEDGKMSGSFIQVSRLFNSMFRPTIRYGILDYLDKGIMYGRVPDKGNKKLQELSFGFSYYPTSKTVLKVEYRIIKEGPGFVDKNNDELGLQAAIRF